MQVEVIQPGLAVVRGALSSEEQVHLATYATSEPLKDRFFTPTGVPNSARTRGRIFDAISTFPDAHRLAALSHGIIATAHAADATLRPVYPTHLLLLLYTAARGMGYHRDDGDNDGDGDAPIVSVTIGTGCLFGVRVGGALQSQSRTPPSTAPVQGETTPSTPPPTTSGAPPQTCAQDGQGVPQSGDPDGRTVLLELRSGDAVVFGGPSRMVPHGVVKVCTPACMLRLYGASARALRECAGRRAFHHTGTSTAFGIVSELTVPSSRTAFRKDCMSEKPRVVG